MLCQDCPDRNSCLKLCQDAEDYVDRDNVYQRELTVPDISYNNFSHFELISNVHLTKREREIVALLGRGLTRSEVAQMLKSNRKAVQKVIERMRKKRRLFLQG